ARLALREACKEPEDLRDLLASEENAARVPAFRDTPIDVWMLLLLFEGHAARAELDQPLVHRRRAHPNMARKLGLLPRSLVENRLEDRDDRLRAAALPHDRQLTAPTATRLNET